MNLEQIYAMAASHCSYLNDTDCLKVYIGSSADNPTTIDVFNSCRTTIDKLGIKARAILTGSFGYFDLEPIVLIERPDRSILMYTNISPDMASDLLQDQVMNGNPRQVLPFCSIGSQRVNGIPQMSDVPLFNLQKRVALRNCGFIDPEDINQYILLGQGYSGLAKALDMNRKDVISELRRAGLRGQGGSGFSLADHWETFCDDGEGEKTVLCNAIDIDPQWTASRLLLESDPHSVLEGMLITAFAVGARNCRVYIDCKNSLAIDRLNKALQQMREYGLLGNNIMGSPFSCEIEIKDIIDSHISEVEAALLCCTDGKQPEPGLLKNSFSSEEYSIDSALAHRAETMSDISAVFQNGYHRHFKLETEQGGGTRIVSLSGDIIHQYTVEVPLGTTLRSIIMNIGGGTTGNQSIKAVQFGGPTGVFLNSDSLDTRVDFETVGRIGLLTGSGRIEVFSSDFCPVGVTRKAISYIHTQSCGKCVFCREGSLQMSDILKDIADGIGRAPYLELLIELGKSMKIGSVCALGQTAPDLVLSGIRLFREDYDSHIKEKRCQLKTV